jgi:hypothetical protein
MKRTAYHREWRAKHPGYKAAEGRRKWIFMPSKRPSYREILGIRVRVNLLGTLHHGGKKCSLPVLPRYLD